MGDDRKKGPYLDTEEADQSVWLMKSPVVVSKAWEKHVKQFSSASSSSSYCPPNSVDLAKVVYSVDPLQSDLAPEVLNLHISSVLILNVVCIGL